MKKIITTFLIIMSLDIFGQDSINVKNDTLDRKATFYHDKFEGRKTAMGDIFRQNKLTAASNYYKLGSIVLVTDPSTGKCVIVTINDRMAEQYTNSRIDLSKKAFRKLANTNQGIIKVKTTQL